MNETKISVATTVAIFLFFTTVMLFSSCRTGRQVVVVEGKDSIRIEERVREIKVTDTLFVEVPVQSAERTTADSTSHLENDYAVSDARVNPDGSLSHSLETKHRTDTIPKELYVQIWDTTIYREKVIPKVVTVEKGLSDWQKMQIRGFWIFLILTSGYIIIRKKFL